MKLHLIHNITWRAALGTAALATALNFTPATLKADDVAASRINELVNLDFLSEYVTPRGMIVANQGLAFQPLLLTLGNLYHDDGFISSIDFDGGAWADISSRTRCVNMPRGWQKTARERPPL